MKKIEIITLHKVYNYGSILQTYASQQIFLNMGYCVEIVDYRRYQDVFFHRFFLPAPDSLNKSRVKKYGYYILRCGSIFLKEIIFSDFLRKYINLSKTYYSLEQLKKNPPIADFYVTGSDQTWNSDYNNGVDGAYFWECLSGNLNKVFSFAASFGKTSFSLTEIEKMKKYFLKYDGISVREKESLSLLADMGFYNTISILDPTLLLDVTNWDKLIKKKLESEKYLLLFIIYSEDNGATDIARKIADQKGLKLIKLSWDVKKDKRIDKLYSHRSPCDFLSLFKYADFVVTNSFHGLAFSLIFERQFVVIPRNEYNSRLSNLLDIVELSDRFIFNKDDLEVTRNNISYNTIRDILIKERKKAFDFLNKELCRNF